MTPVFETLERIAALAKLPHQPLQCSNMLVWQTQNQPTIWGWLIQPIYGDLGDSFSDLPHYCIFFAFREPKPNNVIARHSFATSRRRTSLLLLAQLWWLTKDVRDAKCPTWVTLITWNWTFFWQCESTWHVELMKWLWVRTDLPRQWD